LSAVAWVSSTVFFVLACAFSSCSIFACMAASWSFSA
jgi:hypothetical protein